MALDPSAPSALSSHHRACNLCEAICGLEIETRGADVVSIRADKHDPLSRGHICPKAVALRDLYEDPDRLRLPLKRNGDTWEEMSWDAAFDFAAERLLAIKKTHGPDSVATYLGNPSVHNYGTLTHAPRLLGHFRSKNRFSATSVDQLPHQLLAFWMYGHQLLVPISDLDRTQFFLVLGANPMASNGSLMTVPDFPARLRSLKERGGKMIVLDPRRTETANVADEHHFVRPGTDAAFMIALLATLFEEKLSKPGKLAELTEGLAEIEAAVGAFSISALAAHCGIDEHVIRRIARELAAAPCAAVYGRMGVSTQRYGTLTQWLIQVVNIVTGNFDREGGVLFTNPAIDLVFGPTSRPGHFGKWKSRVRGLPEFAGELPVACLAEEIETPGEGQVRALVTIAGNPALSTPNGKRLERALESLDFMLSIDFYLNETTRHAHLILPPTSALEHDHYDLVFHIFAIRNTARYSPAVFARGENARHDYEIFEGLAAALATQSNSGNAPLPLPHEIVDFGLRAGPYGEMNGHPLKLDLNMLRISPHGVDLGPLAPSLPARLFHADKRIHAAPPELLAELASFRAMLGEAPVAAPSNELLLIGRRHVRSNNSWMHNSERLMKGPTRHELHMHPDDVTARGLSSGARVRVRSRTGEIAVNVIASLDMMRGVVSLPHGFGHDRSGVKLRIAAAHAGASNNDLTDEARLDFSGNAALNGVPVTVEALA